MLNPPEEDVGVDYGSGYYSTPDDISIEQGEELEVGDLGVEPVAMESSGQLDEGEDAFDGEDSDIEVGACLSAQVVHC